MLRRKVQPKTVERIQHFVRDGLENTVRIEKDGARNAGGSPVSLLRYYLHDGIAAFRFELIGKLSAIDLAELEGCWRTAKSSVAGRKLRLDLRKLIDIDDSGRQWLTEMLVEGADYIVESGFSEGLARELNLPAIVSPLGSSSRKNLSRLKRWLRGSPQKPARKPEFNPKSSPFPLTDFYDARG